MKKAGTLLLTLAMLLTLVPVQALAAGGSEAYGTEVWLQDTALQQGALLSDNIYWSEYYQQLRHEYFLTYTPSAAVRPTVAYGEAVCDRITAGTAAETFEAQGFRVVGGINGDFFDVSTGWPLGVVISGGELLSASGEYYAAGFREDGSAVMGLPALKMSAAHAGLGTVSVSSVNKPRVDNGGITLMTYDFRTDHTTGTTTPGVTALCTVLYGRPTIGEELVLTVEEVVEDAAALPIREDQVVLTSAQAGYDVNLAFLRGLAPGDEIVFAAEAADEEWNDVTEAIGAMYLLVMGGQVVDGLDTTYAPRTAIGVKANGDVVLYTVDGRQTGHSMGASLKVLAQRMAELGCVTALGLDGGGSTTTVASLPAYRRYSLINSPSDKTQRKVTNHLMLLSEGLPTGQADHIYLHTSAPFVLPGHTVQLRANLVDTNYFPLESPVELWSDGGTIADGVFTASDRTGPAVIRASAWGLEAETEVLVVETPDEMSIRWNGSAVDSVTLMTGDRAELTAAASYLHMALETVPEDFTWTVDPAVGTIDEHGVLTAGYGEGTGYVTASKGGKSVSLPVTVESDSPFLDAQGHWGERFISELYHRGILTGEQREDGLYAGPDQPVTRLEFAVMLSRYLGLHEADYAGIEAPFDDMDQVEDWAAGAVKAMYALGVITGSQEGNRLVLDGSGVLTRAQAVTMLGRIEERLAPEEPPAPQEPEASEPPAPPADTEIPDWLLDPDREPQLPPEENEEFPAIPEEPAEPEPSSEPEPEPPVSVDLNSFPDAGEIPGYALPHFQSMVDRGVIGGDSAGRLIPNHSLTRAEICKILVTMG